MEFAADSEADFEAWNAALTRVGVVWGDVSDDVRKPDEVASRFALHSVSCSGSRPCGVLAAERIRTISCAY
jgi:hypothetical protein